MRQAHIGKDQVIGTVTKLKGFVHPGEHSNDLPAAFDIKWFEVFLHGMQGIQLVQRFPAKMDPVNTPGIVFGTAIGMFHILRKNKKLVRTYF